MGLGDCPKCWEHMCICGYEYSLMKKDELVKLRDTLNQVLEGKKPWESTSTRIPKVMYHYGNIIVESESEGEFLESLGIKLGRYHADDTVFIDCIVSEEAMKKLDPYWGRFIWSFDQRKS